MHLYSKQHAVLINKNGYYDNEDIAMEQREKSDGWVMLGGWGGDGCMYIWSWFSMGSMKSDLSLI